MYYVFLFDYCLCCYWVLFRFGEIVFCVCQLQIYQIFQGINLIFLIQGLEIDLFNMIWLVLFFCLGNIFFRNILFEVYGLELSMFYWEDNYLMDENYVVYFFVKIYLLLDQLLEEYCVVFKVYFVCDGWDVFVFLAYY